MTDINRTTILDGPQDPRNFTVEDCLAIDEQRHVRAIENRLGTKKGADHTKYAAAEAEWRYALDNGGTWESPLTERPSGKVDVTLPGDSPDDIPFVRCTGIQVDVKNQQSGASLSTEDDDSIYTYFAHPWNLLVPPGWKAPEFAHLRQAHPVRGNEIIWAADYLEAINPPEPEPERTPITVHQRDLGTIQPRLVKSMDDVWEFFQWLSESREFLAYDVETTGLIVGWDVIRLAQFGDGRMGWAMDFEDWKGVARDAIHKYRGRIVMHNALYDMKMSKAEGIIVPQAQAHCSMVMAHLADPAAAMGLKKAAARWVDPRAAWGQNMLKECYAARGDTWATIPTWVPAYWKYGVLDTCLSSLLAEKLYPEIRKDPYELEMATIACLRDAEIAGLKVDRGYRYLADQKLQEEVNQWEAWIEHLYPGINPGSDKQVIDALHKLGAVWNVYTENGNLSVDKDVLGWLGRDESFRYAQLATAINEWRKVDRLLYNYIRKFDNIGSGLNRKDIPVGLAAGGILHPSTKPVAARTGRMSITDPPLQTLPRGRTVRDAIIPRDGHVFVMADYAGMELRALASMANEENMLAAFNRGEDLHAFVAKTLYGENFTKQQRSICKNGNFSKVYGAGAEKFATTAKIEVDQAKEFLATYDQMFPGVQSYMQAVMADVVRAAGGKRKGYGHVTLIDGRWLPVEADKPYKGVNFTIQGGCAVVLKKKIVELDAAGLGEFFRLPVHDELLFEVPQELAAEVRDTLVEVMPERDLFPGVTLEVESDIVGRWGEHYRDDFPKYIDTEDAEWLRTL